MISGIRRAQSGTGMGLGALSQFAGRPDRPVIIGGCPRSGTTLLRSMLDMHPELSVPRETRFVLEAWPRRLEFGDLREEVNRRRLASWIFDRKESEARRLGLDPTSAVERLANASPTLGSLIGLPFVLRAGKHGKPRWGDKRPLYAARMHVIWSLFPNAHFIHVVRDPRACVASMRRLGWWGGEVPAAVELWERSVGTVNQWQPKLAGDQLLEVAYEDLVTDSEATLARVAKFAGLTYDDAAVAQMLRYPERHEQLSRRYHKRLGPPDASRLTSWRNELGPVQVALVEQATAPLMMQFGYEPTRDGQVPPRKVLERLERRRRHQASSRRRRVFEDAIRRYVTYRRPVAADLPSPLASESQEYSALVGPRDPSSRPGHVGE